MRTILLSILITVIAGGSAWFGRGIYDRTYMLEGCFMVVNLSSEDHDIRVQFPSGESWEERVQSRGSHSFRVGDTGEGGVSVFLSDAEITSENGAGYVTSINSPKVLLVQNDGALMLDYHADPNVD